MLLSASAYYLRPPLVAAPDGREFPPPRLTLPLERVLPPPRLGDTDLLLLALRFCTLLEFELL
jgi:hypothetical protein